MALLDSMAQQSPIAGLLARRRQAPQGPGQEMPPLAPPKMPPIQPMQAPTGPIGPGDPRTAAASQQPPPQGLIPVQGGDPDAPVMESREGVTGGILDTLTGLNDPRLSDEENAAATRRGGIVGLLVGGAATVLGGPVGGAIAAIMFGQATGSSTRREALQTSREQALIRHNSEAQSIIAEGDMLDPQSRLRVLGRLIQGGYTEAVDRFLEQDEALAERTADEQVNMVRQDFVSELQDPESNNPEFLLGLAARMGAQGLTAEATALQATANSIEEIRQYNGEIEWHETGDAHVGVDRNGEEVARIGINLSPWERAQIAFDYAQEARLKAEGADSAYLDNLKTLRTEFRGEAKDYGEVANLTTAAMNADDSGPGDMILINALAKLIDPGGRITDADVQNFVNTSGIRDRWTTELTNLLNNEGRLPRQLRQSLVTQVRALHEISQEAYRRNLIDPYRISAARAGVNPNDFIINPFSEERETFAPLGDASGLPGNLDPSGVDDFFSGFGGGG